MKNFFNSLCDAYDALEEEITMCLFIWVFSRALERKERRKKDLEYHEKIHHYVGAPEK